MMTWQHLIERTVYKALSTYVRTYSLFKSGHLITDFKCALYKAMIRSAMTYACSTWEHVADAHLLKLQCQQKSYWKSWQVDTSPWIAHGFQNSLCVWLYN
jgi:hypothetical protein